MDTGEGGFLLRQRAGRSGAWTRQGWSARWLKATFTLLAGLAAGAAAGMAAALAEESPDAAAGGLLDIAVISPPDHGMTRAAAAMGEALSAATGGTLRLRLHHSSRRGNETAMLGQLGRGDLDAAILTVGELARHNDRLNVFFTPYLAKDGAEGGRIVATQAALALAGEGAEALGVRVLGLGTLGLRHIALTSAARPTGTAAFPKGSRIRVTPNPAIADFYAALGAVPQPLPLPAVRETLAGDGLDGTDMDLEIMALRGYEQATPNAILSGHMIFPVAAVVSAAAWSRLSEDHRTVLAAVMRRAMADLATYYARRDPEWQAELAVRGIAFLPVPRATLDAAAARWRDAHPDLAPLAESLRAEAGHAP